MNVGIYQIWNIFRFSIVKGERDIETSISRSPFCSYFSGDLPDVSGFGQWINL